jgi:hypothetical protein
MPHEADVERSIRRGEDKKGWRGASMFASLAT